PYDIWQYSWTGKVDGITGNSGKVDMNYCYKDFPSIIKNAGLNGFTKPVDTAPVEKPVETVETAHGTEKKSIDIQVLVDGVQYSGTVYQDFDDHSYSGLLEE
ncbi:MAG: hypothetical protein IJ642_04625, partial [Oscillospiraceae bacterium]|nr:hypothetical protein [Oscillospiraceae bacterium]